MITTVIALHLVIYDSQQDSTDAPKPTASQIMSHVFEHYAKAQAISGQIRLTQSAQDTSINIVTDLQYDRPAKIYLHQSKNGSKPKEWMVASDGRIFSYDNPHPEFGSSRNTEYMSQHGVNLTLGDVYMAGSRSIGDRNAILDTAIAAPNRLERLRSQWVTLVYQGRVMVDGQLVHKITGQYREESDPSQPFIILKPTGTFEIDVNENDDFVRYVTWERFAPPGQPNNAIEVKSEWVSTLKVGAKTDPSLYRVVVR